MATGLGAAMAFGPDHAAGANDPNEVLTLRVAELRASSLQANFVVGHALPGHVSSAATRIVLPDVEEGWSDAQQKRFQELAVEEAVGTLSAEETVELEQLTLLRRAFQTPRTGSEVLWEFEQRRRTNDLLKTLRRYVEFYEEAGQAR